MFNWRLKILLKIILARLPLPYSFWRKLGLFRHGSMDDVAYTVSKFDELYKLSGLDNTGHGTAGLQGKTILEIGPGDSLGNACITSMLGASHCWFIDTGDYVVKKIDYYQRLAAVLAVSEIAIHNAAAKGMSDAITHTKTFDDYLELCNSKYLTNGLGSFASIEPESIDFCFTNAVLEHIALDEVSSLAENLYRIMRKGGVAVHQVDLKDHLGGGLNNLRFSAGIWESALFRNSGFYTNRLRFASLMDIFSVTGFNCEVQNIKCWEVMPVDKARLAKPFSQMNEEELKVQQFDLILRK